ncbi:type IV conjugative transfer system protein TraV [Vibrio casei]|uniref:Type IV conjugative transfer system protein TraV n=2 Tax=Pseudomonadota TaxID=1224 RepID=A0A368LFU9_9VIBR|nr:type IV conjugative transfer system protein TraV [Vibrio casei]
MKMLNTIRKSKKTGIASSLTSATFKNAVMGLGLVATLSGCTLFNVGSGDYACPGMPDGVQCMSARDVYAATNDGQVPRPMIAGEEDHEEHNDHEEHKENIGKKGSGDVVIDTYVAPRLPNKPIPIRTPAQVMRIWVAPWEDTNGDLIVTGYIYTEIEPRRWVVGESESETEASFRPLHTKRGGSNK